MLRIILNRIFPGFDLDFRDQSVIRNSIGLIIADQESVVALFYDHLAQLDSKFCRLAEDKSSQLEDTTIQFLRHVVLHFDRPLHIIPFVRKTAIQLERMGIEAKDYSTAETALLLAFHELSSDEERQNFGCAWKRCVRAVALEMMDAAYGFRNFPPTSRPAA